MNKKIKNIFLRTLNNRRVKNTDIWHGFFTFFFFKQDFYYMGPSPALARLFQARPGPSPRYKARPGPSPSKPRPDTSLVEMLSSLGSSS